MPYGTIKVDNITFTNGGSDSTITVSGIVEAISGNITATGTIQGATIIGTSTVSGATVTGNTASFTSGTFVSGIFTTQISGATITGNTGNFTTFNAGTANLTSGVFASGTQGAPSLSIGTTTNGLYSPGADQVAISTGGSGRLFINSNGDVGVGTGGTQGTKLHAVGGNIWSGNFYEVGRFQKSSGTAISLGYDNSDYVATVGAYSHDGTPSNLSFWTYPGSGAVQERLRITSAGLVGVGTSTPESYKDEAEQLVVSKAGNCGITVASATNGVGALYFADGTSGSDASRGGLYYSHIDNSMQLLADGSARVYITSGGLVGIGTSSPVAPLHVSGSGVFARLTDTQAYSFETSGPILDFTGNDSSGESILFARLQGSPANGAPDRGFLNIFSRHNGITRSTLQVGTGFDADVLVPNGRLGIGTTDPQEELHIVAASQPYIQVQSTGGTAGSAYYGYNSSTGSASIESTGSIRFAIPGSEAARIDTSGRLLVGTSSTSGNIAGNDKLAVVITGEDTRGGISVTDYAGVSSTVGSYAAVRLQRSYGATDGSFTALPAGSWGLGRIEFNGSNGVGFGTGAAIEGFCDDLAWGNGDHPARLVFSVTPDGGSSPTTSPSAMTINSGQEVLIGYSTDNGAYKLQVNSQIFATSATIATSDGRYKENVVTLDGCVDLVKALRPVSFDWKAQQPITRVDEDGETVMVREAHNFPDGKQVGFIAQEVEEVLAGKPWLGSVIKQNVRPAVTDNDGNELAPEEEFLGIAEGNLVAVLTSALKDAIGRIESLEAEVAAIKA